MTPKLFSDEESVSAITGRCLHLNLSSLMQSPSNSSKNRESAEFGIDHSSTEVQGFKIYLRNKTQQSIHHESDSLSTVNVEFPSLTCICTSVTSNCACAEL